jgi:hypothetical protein
MPAMTNSELTALSPPDFCPDHCIRDPKKIHHSRVSNWGHNIHKPFSQGRQPLELSFYLLHRILGSFHTRLIGGSHEVHDRVPALPSHGPSNSEHGVNGVE